MVNHTLWKLKTKWQLVKEDGRWARRGLNIALVLSLLFSNVAVAVDLPADPSTLASVFSAAQGGDVIQLASGNYGTFNGGIKPGPVMFRLQPGAIVTLQAEFNPAANITFDGVPLAGLQVRGASRNLVFSNVVFTAQVTFRDATGPMNVIFDHCTWGAIDSVGYYEGRLSVVGSVTGSCGITVQNSKFGPGGNLDGIQTGGDGLQILNNEFVGIRSGLSGIHTDAIQLYGSKNTVISGNYIHDCETGIMAPDGTDHEIIEQNVIDPGEYPYAIMIGSDQNSIIHHNTLPDGPAAWGMRKGIVIIRAKPGRPASTGTIVQNNVLGEVSVETGCSANVNYNLIANGAPFGSQDIHGLPTYVGGAPTNYAGFAVAAASLGHGNASDGTDRGININSDKAGKLATSVKMEVPPPGRMEALARLQCELPAWRTSLPKNHPRTFFTPAQWAALPQRWAGVSPDDRRWLDAALARAEEVAAEPVTTYLSPEQFVADGKASVFNSYQELWQRPVGDKMVLLSFALAMRPESQSFREALRATVLTACTYPSWGINPDKSQTQTNVDLTAAHVVRGIAIAYDWHPEIWSTAEKKLIRDTVQQRLTAMLAGAYGAMFWAHQYQANHNHVDVAALGICGLVFLDEIPEAGEWLAHALNNFERVALEFNSDGSSHEGVPYWSYGASFLLQFIEATRPVLPTAKLYDAPFLRATARYRISSSTPGFGGTLPWGDAPSRDYYGPHHILYRLAAQYRDASAQFVAANLPFPPQGPGRYSGPSENHSLDILAWTALWYDPALKPASPRELDYHLPVGDLVTTRSGWGDGDYLLAIKSGFNNRNHCHLDAGALAFSIGDEWLITTPGYGKGSANQDFWQSDGPRWDYFANRTESHATLLVDGANQSFDRATARGRVTSFATTLDWCWTEVDLTTAYTGMEQVRRQVLHRRGEYVLVLDQAKDSQTHQIEWLAQMPPSAVAVGPILDVAGKTGGLQIKMLSPAGSFQVRQPNAPHLDVPAEQLRTWSVADKGTNVEFAALLIPHHAGAPTPTIRNDVVSKAGQRQVVLHSGDWTDTILVGDVVKDLSVMDCSAQASSLMLRRGGKAIESILALQAQRVQTPEFTISSALPTTLGLRRINGDVWLVNFSPNRPVTLSKSHDWKLVTHPADVNFTDDAKAVVYRGDHAAMLRAIEAAERNETHGRTETR